MAGRPSLSQLEGRTFDVLVVGAGVNGASAAQHLASAGYSVLLIDKGDFGSGSSSRSSRILGNGMHYLAGGHSPWDFLLRPKRFLAGCRMARFALASRAQMVQTSPERLHRVKFQFPIYRNDLYKPWQFDAGMTVLRALGTHGVSLNYKRIPGKQATKLPLLKWLRNPDEIVSVATFDQYQFRWPERVVMDTVLNAAEAGATARNYTALNGLHREPDGLWRAELGEASASGNATARIGARVVLNTAGIWIDKVNALGPARPGRKILGTKGIHIAVRLPPECQGMSVTWQNRHNEHMYVLPWNDLHYLGPTETVYEGDLDDINPTEAEIEWVIDEVSYRLPGMGLTRKDVVYAWAGVRPWTHSPEAPKGLRVRVLHDLAAEGMPGVFALTGGPLMSHRSAGRDACETIQKRIPPSGSPRPLTFKAHLPPASAASPGLTNDLPDVSIDDLRHVAESEQPITLVDLLFRRLPIGWSPTMGSGAAQRAAEAVSDILRWDEARIAQEVENYRSHLRHRHLMPH